MKKFLSFLFVCLLAFLIVGCNQNNGGDKPEDKPGEDTTKYSLTLNEADKTVSLEVGGEKKITVTFEGGTLEWTSSDSTVVSVENGTLKALKAGTAAITVTLKEKTEYTATITVTVTEPAPVVVEVTGIALAGKKTEVEVGEEFTLSTVITPNNATDKTVTWASSDATVATVTDGKVKALKAGTTEISAKAGSKEDKFTLTVNEAAKGLTTKNLQEALKNIEKEYKESKKASVEVNLVNGEDTMKVVLTYELGNDNLFKALQYELTGEKTIAIYIQDETVYSTANGVKSKETLDETVNETLTNDYGLDTLLKDVTAFYNEKGLYACLTLTSSDNGIYVFDLDLAKYDSLDSTTVFRTAGKEKVSIIVTTINEAITAVKVEVKTADKTLSTEVKYLGLDKSPVYPSDLDTYK